MTQRTYFFGQLEKHRTEANDILKKIEDEETKKVIVELLSDINGLEEYVINLEDGLL